MKRRKDEIRLPRCPDCRHEPLERRRTTHRWVEGVDEKREYTAEIDVVACPSCGCEVIDEYARRQKHEVWCGENGLLGPAQIRTLRKSLGLSTELFAKLLGVGPASISRWERGILVQNVANDRLMKLLRIGGNVRELALLAGVSVPDTSDGTNQWKPRLSGHFTPDAETFRRQAAFVQTTFGFRMGVA